MHLQVAIAVMETVNFGKIKKLRVTRLSITLGLMGKIQAILNFYYLSELHL